MNVLTEIKLLAYKVTTKHTRLLERITALEENQAGLNQVAEIVDLLAVLVVPTFEYTLTPNANTNPTYIIPSEIPL
jgi:hypothetical protein